MALWREVYEKVEMTFWNSLSKKLASFLFLLVINLAYLGVYLLQKGRVADLLAQGEVSPQTAEAVLASLQAGWYVMLALTLVALLFTVGQILYLRYLVVRPVREITSIFNEIARGEGDFSRNLPMMTHDELRELAEGYNRFAAKMREVIGRVRSVSVNIAREAVVVKVRVEGAAGDAERQMALTDAVFGASTESTEAIDSVSGNAQRISESTRANLDIARDSLREMEEIAVKINVVTDKVAHFNTTVDGLSTRSESVKAIASLIREIADQTNMLALNAAIEAARAGEAGRGFAVVADEVRKLAERVNTATEEIGRNIAGMIDLVASTRSENEVINTDVNATREVVTRSASQFRSMVAAFEINGEQLLQIASAMEQLSATNAQVHDNVTAIHDLSGKVTADMRDSAQRTRDLSVATESVQELVSRFKIGQGAFDKAVDRTRAFRDLIQRQLEEMAQGGLDVFDRRYVPVAGTDPQKYKVAWGDEFTRRCQQSLEDCLAAVPGGVFAVALNQDSYLSTHNLKFSKPLTGNREVDLVGNRTCRKFESPAELRAARNTSPMLLQTYLRDTGEVLCDLAMPIEVGGRVWGNVRVGMVSDALIDH